MRGQLVSGLVIALLTTGIAVVTASPAAADPVKPKDPDFPPLPAGATVSGNELSAEKVHKPVVRRKGQQSTPSTAGHNPPVQVGTNSWACTYHNANWWKYKWSGAPGTWERSASGYYNHFGTQDLRVSSLVWDTSTANYEAEIGQGLQFDGGGWARAKVEFPWQWKGSFTLHSEFAPTSLTPVSSATVDMRFIVDLMKDDTSSALEVDSVKLSANQGLPIETGDVEDSGFNTRTVSITGHGEVLKSAFRTKVSLETQTNPFTNARASFDFSPGNSRGWWTGQTSRWIITLQENYVLVDCG